MKKVLVPAFLLIASLAFGAKDPCDKVAYATGLLYLSDLQGYSTVDSQGNPISNDQRAFMAGLDIQFNYFIPNLRLQVVNISTRLPHEIGPWRWTLFSCSPQRVVNWVDTYRHPYIVQVLDEAIDNMFNGKVAPKNYGMKYVSKEEIYVTAALTDQQENNRGSIEINIHTLEYTYFEPQSR